MITALLIIGLVLGVGLAFAYGWSQTMMVLIRRQEHFDAVDRVNRERERNLSPRGDV